MVSTEENVANVRRFYDEVINKGNLKMVEEMTAKDFVDHSLAPGMPPGVEGAKAWFRTLRQAFPDGRATIDEVIVQGDKVVVRGKMTGTHKGEFMGIPPTGKRVSIEGIDILRLSGGKTVEHWGQWDNLGLLQQLGVVPPPGKPPQP